MKSIVYELIRKDWELNRVAVGAGIVLGILATGMTFFGGTVPAVICVVCFYWVMGASCQRTSTMNGKTRLWPLS